MLSFYEFLANFEFSSGKKGNHFSTGPRTAGGAVKRLLAKNYGISVMHAFLRHFFEYLDEVDRVYMRFFWVRTCSRIRRFP